MRRSAAVFAVLVASISSASADEDDDAEVVVLKTLHSFPGLDVVETINQARHEHGGPPAHIHHATLNVEVRDARAHTISVKKLDIVHVDCELPPAKRGKTATKPLKISGYELYTWDDADPIAKGTASIRLPGGKPRRLSVHIEFDGIETYSGCAFALDLVVDRVRKKIELPLHVIRFEPLRKQP